MTSWIAMASSKKVVQRALKYALVVGALLIAINHGDAVLSGDLTLRRLMKMLLTVFVPYAVSTSSSVSAMRDQASRDGGGV